MKILHVIPTLSPMAGGPTEVAIHLVKELNSLGAKAEILTTDDDGSNRLIVPFENPTIYRGVPVRFFKRIDPRLKEFIISPSAVSWMIKHLKDYDMLDIHYLFSFVPLMARSIARRRKLSYTVRTMGQLSPWALQQSKIKKRLFFSLQEFRNLLAADGLHSTSRAEEADIRAFGLPNNVINLPLGVSRPDIIPNASGLMRTKYNIPADRFVLLFLSRLHYKKRPDLAIEILREVKASHNVHLILAGNGDKVYENQLKQLVSNSGIMENVTFTGFVSGYEKDILLQGADLFILPSFSENFGIAVAEAIAGGTPAIITPDVQIAEYISEYQAGILAKGTRTDFASAISSCISEPVQLELMRVNGLRLVNDVFNWNKIAGKLLVSYQEILRHRSTQ